MRGKCSRPKVFNLLYEGIIKYYSDEDTVETEVILQDGKRVNGYRSDIEIENGKRKQHMMPIERHRISDGGQSRFLSSYICRPISLSERALQLKLAHEMHGMKKSKKLGRPL